MFMQKWLIIDKKISIQFQYVIKGGITSDKPKLSKFTPFPHKTEIQNATVIHIFYT